MKERLLEKLRTLDERLRKLRGEIKKLGIKQVSRKELQKEAETLADLWVEELRSPLEYRFKKIPADTITKYADGFKQLHVLSRPNNLVKSYVSCLNSLTKKFKDDLILPVQQSQEPITGNAQLSAIVERIGEGAVSDYLTEAVSCAQNGHVRAGIVMGWCAAIDHIQKSSLCWVSASLMRHRYS